MFLAVPSMTALSSASEQAASFRARWQPVLNAAIAPAALEAQNIKYPSHCPLAVVGAGWGGVYAAWRLAVDTKTVNASDVCVFEANGYAARLVHTLNLSAARWV